MNCARRGKWRNARKLTVPGIASSANALLGMLAVTHVTLLVLVHHDLFRIQAYTHSSEPTLSTYDSVSVSSLIVRLEKERLLS